MVVCEIYINRRGINTMEVPRQVEVVAGDTLTLKFINMGHPTHVSISATNSQMYTPFIQENLYVSDVQEYDIPIKDGPYAGVFDLEVVTGYGTKKSTFKVFVTKKCEPPPKPAQPAVRSKSLILSINASLALLAVGIVLYIAWLLLRAKEFQIADVLNLLGFLLVLAGVSLTWWSHRSS